MAGTHIDNDIMIRLYYIKGGENCIEDDYAQSSIYFRKL
jgi:hypothetical protein